MKESRRQIVPFALLILAVLSPVASLAGAARNARKPGIGFVYPAGGQKGQTFEVKLAGRLLDGISEITVSGSGVKAELIEHVKPLNGREINLLRDRLKELEEKVKPEKQTDGKSVSGDSVKTSENADGETDTDMDAMREEMAEIKEKLANPKNRNRENPQLAEDVKLKVTVSPDAEPGRRELRLKTNLGLSNPIAFYVGELAEYNEKEPNSKEPDAGAPSNLPLILNGQIMPGDVDRFRLNLSKGQKLVMAVSARELIPYLADAVPGWFQATLALYDGDGKELAYVDDYRFEPDPVLFYEIPRDGEYILEVKDAIYRGREDFVYRIAVGEFPFVTSIFPLGARVGDAATVKLNGWNLPADELKIDATDKKPGLIPVCVHNNGLVSNTVPFALGDLPELLEREPNSREAFAQAITPGIVLNGRIDEPGDCDIFKFESREGDKIVAEVYARRLNSPLDSALKLTDTDGRVIAANDDHEDKASGLVTHHADSMLTATLPADGTYYLEISDAQEKGGTAYAYRIRISPPMPDFELRAVPSSINIRAGATAPITVYAVRKDGFAGDITISLTAAPEGFSLKGPPLTAEKESVELTLKAPPAASRTPITLRLSGRAQIEGQEVVRKVVPADDMMQAFIYRHLVPAEDLEVAVLGRAGNSGAIPKKPNSDRP